MRNRRIQTSRKQKKLKNVDPMYRKEESSHSFFKKKRKDWQEKKMIESMKDQAVPRRAAEIMAFQEQDSDQPHKTKKKRNANVLVLKTGDEGEDTAGHKRSLRCGNATIQQGLYETDEQFLRRLSKYAASAQAEADIEEKFDVDFCEQNEVLDTSKEPNEEKKSNRKKKRNERIKQKRKNAKQKRHNDDDDNKLDVRDAVKFGEEVEAPPDLSFVKFKKSAVNKNASD